MKKLTIALDADDVLYPCVEPAAWYCGIDPKRITSWDIRETDLTEGEAERFLTIVNHPGFVSQQKPTEAAVEMVRSLYEDGHEILIASAVPPGVMGVRGLSLLKYFPFLDQENIMLGARKELLHVDVLLDDNPGNLLGGHAKYPVLFRTNHNRNAKGFLSVNSEREFLEFIRRIANTPEDSLPRVNATGRPGIICLVGPSGSGKSFICDELVKNPIFRKARAITDRAPRKGEVPYEEYLFVSGKQFDEALADGELLENTVYAEHRYGISKKEIESIWAEGRIAIKPVDITGAKAIRSAYPDRTLILFIRRDKEALMRAILERDVPVEDKVNRIMSLDAEYANESLCDWTIANNGSLNHAVEQVMRLI